MSNKGSFKEKTNNFSKATKEGFKSFETKAGKVKTAIIQKLDHDNDGVLDITDIILLALKTPGVHITRDSFLQKELYKNYPEEIITKAIETTPAEAGIDKKDIEKIANEVIKLERYSVSGISLALGAPGGWAMAATIPADILQYYGYTLRATQKLLYLYGFPEIDSNGEGIEVDTETLNTIVVCLGVMNGVAGANNAIKAMAKALAIGVEKKLLNTALTKGAFYPFIKSVLKWFGVKLTKSIFAGFFKKAIPIVGGVVGGGITFLSFKPCCVRLQNALQDTMLSNPNHISSKEEDKIVEGIINGTVVEITDMTENEDENLVVVDENEEETIEEN